MYMSFMSSLFLSILNMHFSNMFQCFPFSIFLLCSLYQLCPIFNIWFEYSELLVYAL
jgi:hypothetical protein